MKIRSVLFLVLMILFMSCKQSITPKENEEKELEIELSNLGVWGNCSFDPETGFYATNEPTECIGLWLEGQTEGFQEYNCIRIRYESEDFGFFLVQQFPEKEEEYYCPSNMNEFIVPLNMDLLPVLKAILIKGIWNNNVHIKIKQLTLLKRDNPGPSLTYKPDNKERVIDNGSRKEIDVGIDAWDVVPDMGVGFQYTLFGASEYGRDFGIDSAYAWGYPIESKETIHAIAEKGFRTLRLQVSGSFHVIDSKLTLDPEYMKKLKKVVDWAIDEGMYVVIVEGCCSYYYPAETSDKPEQLETFKAKNKWIEEHLFGAGYCINSKYQFTSEKYLKAFWSQIAAAFNNSYDEHLVFEFMNEPVNIMHDHDWHPHEECTQCQEDTRVLNELNQISLDTIRATGGNNSQRIVMVPTLGQDFSAAGHADFKLPTDSAQNKIIVAVHDYPMGSNISEGDIKAYYNSSIKENCIINPFKVADEACFKKHIPVAVTEVGCSRWIGLAERMACIKDFMAEVTKDGRSCAVTMMENQAVEKYDYFGYFNKHTNTWYEDEFVDLMIKMAAKQDISSDEDFINSHRETRPSIVGEELLDRKYLSESQFGHLTDGTFVCNSWDKSIHFLGDVFVRTVPSHYKLQLEFNIDRNAYYSSFLVMWQDAAANWILKPLFNKDNILSGGTYYNDTSNENISLDRSSDTITLILAIDEEMASHIESSRLHLQGFGATLTSVTIVE